MPARDVRYYANPPYQYSRAASFEIAFGRPLEGKLLPQDDEVFGEMAALLVSGLSSLHAADGDKTPVAGLGPEEETQLFEAIKALTPPTRGGIDRIEIGGTLVERLPKPAVLTREDRRKVVERIKVRRRAPRSEAPFRASGRDLGSGPGHLHVHPPSAGPSAGSWLGPGCGDPIPVRGPPLRRRHGCLQLDRSSRDRGRADRSGVIVRLDIEEAIEVPLEGPEIKVPSSE